MKKTILFLSIFVAVGNPAIGAGPDASANSNSASSSTAGSAATFTGKNGRVSVNGDLVQAKDGVLTVNGVAYGTVNENAVVTYTVRDQEKTLAVDGAIRKPVR